MEAKHPTTFWKFLGFLCALQVSSWKTERATKKKPHHHLSSGCFHADEIFAIPSFILGRERAFFFAYAPKLEKNNYFFFIGEHSKGLFLGGWLEVILKSLCYEGDDISNTIRFLLRVLTNCRCGRIMEKYGERLWARPPPHNWSASASMTVYTWVTYCSCFSRVLGKEKAPS